MMKPNHTPPPLKDYELTLGQGGGRDKTEQNRHAETIHGNNKRAAIFGAQHAAEDYLRAFAPAVESDRPVPDNQPQRHMMFHCRWSLHTDSPDGKRRLLFATGNSTMHVRIRPEHLIFMRFDHSVRC